MKRVFLVAEIDETGRAIDIKECVESLSGNVEHIERKLKYRSAQSARNAIDQLEGVISMMVIGKHRERYATNFLKK